MAIEPRYIDLDDDSDLARLADEVQATNEPRFLRRGGKPIAVIAPTQTSRNPRSRKRRLSEDERHQAFLSSAGGWKDVDTDALLADIYKQRERSRVRHFDFDLPDGDEDISADTDDASR